MRSRYTRCNSSILNKSIHSPSGSRDGSNRESYIFLQKELPVRLANIMKEISLLPDPLLAMPSVKLVMSWLVCLPLLLYPPPHSPPPPTSPTHPHYHTHPPSPMPHSPLPHPSASLLSPSPASPILPLFSPSSSFHLSQHIHVQYFGHWTSMYHLCTSPTDNRNSYLS